MSLKEKTVNGLAWSFFESIASQGITFIVGIVLARLITAKEFGLIGIISIFIAISSSFINSGFGSALIKKQNCTDADYSTIFYFNLSMGIFFFFLLFFLAHPIAIFFNEPELTSIIQVLGIVLIIDALSIIQRTILTKRVDFQLQTKITIISGIISGVIGITLALLGFGVWSLVAKQISQQALNSILLWLWNNWLPKLIFSIESFKQLFSFGYKLLISGLIDTIYRNIYYAIIGKYFSSEQLGYYTRADQFQSLPSSNLQTIIGRVSYPVLSSIQDDIPALSKAYRRLIKSTMFITFLLMIGLAAIAKPMIITLIGDKWIQSAIYLQLLCFVGMFYPLHALNLNMLQVQGRSDLFLRLEIIKKTLAVPIIIIGINYGIKAMIYAMIVNTLIAYYLNSYWSGRFLAYSTKQQIIDILPSFLLAIVVGAVLFLENLIPLSPLIVLIIQTVTGISLTIIICELSKFSDYIYIKNLVFEKYLKRNNQ